MGKSGYDLIKEGKAKIAVPRYSGKDVSSRMPVFYNPAMKSNRDITILLMAAAAKLYGIKKWQIADAMAATGVRGIRMVLELGSSKIESLKMNDYSVAAVKLIKKNLLLNRIKTGGKVSVSINEANKFLLDNKGFNYIDIDPFGYPGLFLDAAVKKTRHNGILAVTATDTSALAGTAAAACRRKYLATPLRNGFMHETGIRILVRLCQLIGTMHEKALIPVFSYYKDHYIRAFFHCKEGSGRVDGLLAQHKEILYCNSCCNKKIMEDEYDNNGCSCGKDPSRAGHDWAQSPKGDLGMIKAGPLWAGKLFDTGLARRLAAAATDEKTKKFLKTIAEEAKIEGKTGAGFYAIEHLCEKHRIRQQPKTAQVIKRLQQKGYNVSQTHCTTTGVKTDAPLKAVLAAVKGE